MKRAFLLASFLLFSVCLFRVPPVNAAQCSYGSTQARVQPNDTIPWQPSITVGCEKKFRVGGFHNGTGQFANDVNIQVTGPGNFGAYFKNGQDVQVSQPGAYTITVKTNGQDGGGCTEQAHVSVVCNNSPPSSSQCTNGSTQARVQNNVSVPWTQHTAVGCERVFNVGSFHNGTGQFAPDTYLYVSGPGIGQFYGNGQQVHIPNSVQNGTYSLSVTTANQSGPACTETASVSFNCPVHPTATPIPNGQCIYSSTQSRIQKNATDPWVKNLALNCNESFTVGSFHNNSAQWATDTSILVTDPYGYGAANIKNGQRIRAFFPGQYMITAATPGQNGPQCADISFVTVQCNAPSIPDFWKSILQQYMVM